MPCLLASVLVLACQVENTPKITRKPINETRPVSTVDTARDASSAVLLSDVVPPLVADFLRQAGTDRPLRRTPKSLKEIFESPSVDQDLIVRVLRPIDHEKVTGPITIIQSVVIPGHSPLVAGSSMVLKGGKELAWGAELHKGNVIHHGMILNAGTTTALLQTAAGQVELMTGSAIFVRPRTCGVSCNAETSFACCLTDVQAENSCKCVADGTQTNCDSGGPGAIACSLGTQR